MDSTAQDWTPWAPDDDIAPECLADGDILAIHSTDPACHGGWRRRQAVTGGRAYRFTVRFRTQGVAHARRAVNARLDWRDADGVRIRQPDLAREMGTEGGWTTLSYAASAPETARSVVMELALAGSAGGTVWWDRAALEEAAPEPGRIVRAATIHHRPCGTRSAAESVAQFCRLAETAAPSKPDIVCLPEGITVIGTGRECRDAREPVPGPTTRTLGTLAKSLGSYLVAGVYEQVGPAVYNTAVLIGRDGELVGAYRKTHLPREELEGGLTPGDEYPVFRTDFGTVGLMICWDLQFPEPARALALRGAEVILLPIWGGSEILARARALENHVFLVSSSYDMRSFIVDPSGTILAEAMDDSPLAFADLALDQPIYQPWTGDMKARTWKERRPDIQWEP